MIWKKLGAIWPQSDIDTHAVEHLKYVAVLSFSVYPRGKELEAVGLTAWQQLHEARRCWGQPQAQEMHM